MDDRFKIEVNSEIGELQGVILHAPGSEIENMTPENAENALFSDILNLDIAKNEYSQLNGVLKKVTNVFQVSELLSDILNIPDAKHNLLKNISANCNIKDIKYYLSEIETKNLTEILMKGLALPNNSLTNYFSEDKFTLKPLYNFFFTRDASSTVFNSVLINKMANEIRKRESIIMEAIFDFHPKFETKTVNPIGLKVSDAETMMEGGDILIARDDIILVGTGSRTSSQGIDFIANTIGQTKEKLHIIVQQLPHMPESFIHLDMVFTLIDHDKCMVYEPLILQNNQYKTIHINIENGKIISIKEEKNIIDALEKLGMPLNPLSCGGNVFQHQAREQWHSGANFFAFAPGKIIGYARNKYTIKELNDNGFSVLKANDVISGKENIDNHKKLVVTIEGSELPRGGGGARCMTMPIKRKNI